MPWFITSVLIKDKNLPHSSRVFGFYEKYIDAYEAVNTNRGSMNECLYNYLVVEYIEEGIHPHVHKEEWWNWNDTLTRWEMMSGKPYFSDGIINWALG